MQVAKGRCTSTDVCSAAMGRELEKGHIYSWHWNDSELRCQLGVTSFTKAESQPDPGVGLFGSSRTLRLFALSHMPRQSSLTLN
ncbi:protein of unknown function [Pseudorhizobium banfieldiae]|uniref:Uncharacterized protein n=1 Tax=Pseudorhizobium banfieldiae TaxID=1125847 RepID=L0NK15_9HYPH|nr:protein of unknown function [Pseudorhizobium banfieldiae]